MPQASTTSFVLSGMRILCGIVFLALVLHDFRLQGWPGVFVDIAIAISVVGITHRNRQGIA